MVFLVMEDDEYEEYTAMLDNGIAKEEAIRLVSRKQRLEDMEVWIR